MLRYKLDASKLKTAISENGWKSLSSFAQEQSINRATLNHYLNGRGPFSEPFYDLCDKLKVDPIDMLCPVLSEIDIPGLEVLAPLVKDLVQNYPRLCIVFLNHSNEESAWVVGVSQSNEALSTFDFLGVQDLVNGSLKNSETKVEVLNLDLAKPEFFHALQGDPVFIGGNLSRWEYLRGVIDGARRMN